MQLGHKTTAFSRWNLWEVWDYSVEVHLQFSVTACNIGSWAPNLWMSLSFEGNRLELSVSCIYCCTIILCLIIPLPWDFTSCLKSPGGPFCLDAYFISGMLPFLRHSWTGHVGSYRCFHVTYSATSECYDISRTLPLPPPLFLSYTIISDTFQLIS